MRTHGDYKAQIDSILGIKSAEVRPDVAESKEMQKLKKELKREKQAHSKYRAMYSNTLTKKGDS